MVDLGEEIDLTRAKAHDLDVVVDRIVVRDGVKGRVTDSVELALKLGDGTVLVDWQDGSEPVVMSERLVSWEYGITLPPLEPRLFSFNSPHGACPTCDGLGTRSRVDPERVVPDQRRTLREGAIAAFGRRGSVATATEVDRVVKTLGINPDTAWQDIPEELRQAVLYGTPAADKKKKKTRNLRGHHPEARADARDRRTRGRSRTTASSPMARLGPRISGGSRSRRRARPAAAVAFGAKRSP